MIAGNITHIRERIAAAAQRTGRTPTDITLVAVTKTYPATDALEAVRAGALDLGENRVQEAIPKIAELSQLDPVTTPRWHLIGHLQSNKADIASQCFDWVQTVDRMKLVDALAAHRPAARGALNVLVQVNIDDESSKHGCVPSEVPALVAAIRAAPSLRLRGLMAIPAPHAEPERRRDAFARMRRLFDTVAGQDPAIDTLSMGMSDDLELAIAEGATMVRVGSALFGARPAP